MTLISRTVLIVEDEALIGLGLREVLLDLGYRVAGPVLDLERALDSASHDELDFALLDFNLADGTNSIPVAEALTARHIRYAIITGGDIAAIRQSLPKAAILSKPVETRALQEILP